MRVLLLEEAMLSVGGSSPVRWPESFAVGQNYAVGGGPVGRQLTPALGVMGGALKLAERRDRRQRPILLRAVAVLSEAELITCLAEARPRMVRLAASMLGDWDAAEDAVQDSAMKALAARSSFRSEANVCSWVQRICINSCQDVLRHRQSASARDRSLEQEARWRDPGYTVDPEAVAIAAQESDRLRAAFAELSPEQKRAVVLHDLEGFTSAEIAALAGLPLPTVKSHLRRGRQALVTLLGEETP